MISQHLKNRLIIVVLFLMAIIPFLIAVIYKQNPELLPGRSNKGQLIIPPVLTDRNEVSGFDKFSSEHLDELKGHWLLINVVTGSDCNQVCIDAIHKSRQIQLMLNKDFTRTRRVAVISKDVNSTVSDQAWMNDRALLKLRPKQSFLDKLSQVEAGSIPEGMLFLMDPLGNLMMQYESGFDPYQVKSDLSHLLRISQIG
jgi:hypothetical protein